MTLRASSSHISALALAFAVAGCGDGSGSGMTSTPPPPASYTKIVDMTGNRTFQTAGVTYTVNASGFSNGSSNVLGSGVTIAYNAAADSYTLTGPGGSPTQTFGPGDSPTQVGSSLRYTKTTASGQESLSLTPSAALSYALFGSWGQGNASGSTIRLAVGGSPTLASDMPKTGSANYTVAGVGGGANANGVSYSLNGNSTATFSANFAAGTVATTLNLAGTPQNGGGPVSTFGAFTGTGTIASNSPGFSGTLTGTPATGVFAGAFFGPQAAEMALSYYLNSATFSAAGQFGGVKQ